jgi:putative transposase
MCLKHEEFAAKQYYHMYSDAVEGHKLFWDRVDYENAIKLMSKYYSHSDIALIAYCLMPSHYHILVYQKADIPAYSFNYKWSAAYSRYYNSRHNTIGTIFSNNLQSLQIKDENALLRLCANIHLNPVDANLTTDIAGWEWSNYPEWIQQRNSYLYDSCFKDSHIRESQKYIDFVSKLKPNSNDRKLLLDV